MLGHGTLLFYKLLADKKEIETLRQATTELQTTTQDMEYKLLADKKEIETLRQANTKLQITKEEIESKLLADKKEIEEAHNELQETKQEIEAMEGSIESLSANLLEIKQEFESKLNKRLQQQVELLHQESSKENGKSLEYLDGLAIKEKECTKYSNKCEKLAETIKELQDKNKTLIEASVKDKSELGRVLQFEKQVDLQKEHNLNAQKEANARINELLSTIEVREKELDKYRRDYSQLLNTSQCEIKSLKNSLQHKDDRVVELTKKVENEMNKSQIMMENLLARISSLDEKWANLEQIELKTSLERDRLAEENKDLKIKISELNNKYESQTKLVNTKLLSLNLQELVEELKKHSLKEEMDVIPHEIDDKSTLE